MTLPTSWKDQLAAFDFEVPCDDIRLGGMVTSLHTSSSVCAITVTPFGPAGYICGTPTFDPDIVYVAFDVVFRNAFACPPFNPPDTVDDVLTCSHPIYRTQETSTYIDLLGGIRRFRVWVEAGTAFPICDPITLTAENTCSDIGIGVWKPSCNTRDCANCNQIAYNVPDLAFNKDVTWYNPVSYATWLASGPPATRVWVEKYRMKQTFSGPTRMVAISKVRVPCNTNQVARVDYETDFTMLEQWNGKDWQTGSPIDVDWEWTVSGKAYIRFALGGEGPPQYNFMVSILLNRVYSHTYRQWRYRNAAEGGGFGLVTKSWNGCFQSVNPPSNPADCVSDGWAYVNLFPICRGKSWNPQYACSPSDVPQEITTDLMWAGVNWNGTAYTGTPQFPVAPKILPGSYIITAYAPGLDVSLSSIPTPCGTAKFKFVTC